MCIAICFAARHPFLACLTPLHFLARAFPLLVYLYAARANELPSEDTRLPAMDQSDEKTNGSARSR